ncbi:MAG TPA: M56 family metallopeptidase [Chitinophagaceae bacterium]|nr:M56 family metallopeptidase [Chitinophagaceae bacterium]
MSLLLQYLIKLSISMALVYIFYRLLLRRLTFYGSNRWYLLGFTLLSFIIPLINITPLLSNMQESSPAVLRLIPSVHQYTVVLEEATHCPAPVWSASYDKWDWIMFGLIAGGTFLLLRFLVRIMSYRRIRSRAKLVSAERHVKVYEVAAPVNPFSFGNSVFINPARHSGEELHRIILHELVHVRQRHTLDIIWAEVCCMLNWYNPFVWMLRKAIRQNLEFIADQQVLENGADKKQYQYLLLKVTGNYPFSIANQFNFSSLKKRIAMMNKNKSARISLIRFVWVLPLAAVILVSFRRQQQSSNADAPVFIAPAADTLPPAGSPNEKGYYLSIIDKKGNCTIVVKDKSRKEITRILLTDWDKKPDYYTSLYGELPPPPPAPPAPPAKASLPDHVQQIQVKDEQATVYLKNGKTEKYNLADAKQRTDFEDNYGKMPVPPAPPAAPLSPLDKEAADYEITDKSAWLRLKNGTEERYDLTNKQERENFEKKYGKIYEVNAAAPVPPVPVSYSNAVAAPPVPPAPPVAIREEAVFTGNEDIVITITAQSTRAELDNFKQKMKEKGVELEYETITYDPEGRLSVLKGTMRSGKSTSYFTAIDFKKLQLAIEKAGGQTWLKVWVDRNNTNGVRAI